MASPRTLPLDPARPRGARLPHGASACHAPRPWRLLTLAYLTAGTFACSQADDPEPAEAPPAPTASARPKAAPGAAPELPPELQPSEDELAAADADPPDAAPPPPYTGPYFAVTKIAVAVYSEPKFDPKLKLGYLRNGGRSPALGEPVSTANCSGGWYQLRDLGYVCGNQGTTDLNHPEVKFAIKAPDVAEVLPYLYARNAKNGTPLYRSVPSREQMLRYEPYLDPKKQAEEKAKAERAKAEEKAKAEQAARAKAEKDKPKGAEDSKTDDGGAAKSASKAADAGAPKGDAGRKSSGERAGDQDGKGEDKSPDDKPIAKGDAGAAGSSHAAKQPSGGDTVSAAAQPGDLLPQVAGDEGDAGAPDVPWWQQADAKDKLHEITLEKLEAESDGVLARRMVAGFYVAVDKTFNWNGRTWYKTTKGLVAPAERFWQTAGSKFQGVELGAKHQLPVAWAYGGNKTTPTYSVDPEKGSAAPKGRVNRFEALQLSGRTAEVKGTNYSELADGSWVKNIHVRVTKPGDLPKNLAPEERWIDVNVSQQTLVVYQGTRPIYATIVSTGKSSNVRTKDHSTPLGEWRVREKHVTTTMDGDGSAAGDLPYSIEDVPYVLYYQGSYALHGAFWHTNFGVKMSHGCVNLAPLDAKWVFMYADPQIPEGWHGAWSTPERPGSRIRVHD